MNLNNCDSKTSLFQIISQDLLKKYITYAKLNVFPRLHDADLDKLTLVYAELRRESSVSPHFYSSLLFMYSVFLGRIKLCLTNSSGNHII